MTHLLGFGLAITATASFALAGGGGDDEKKKAKAEAKPAAEAGNVLEALGNTPTQDNGPTLSATPGEGFTIVADELFTLNIRNQVQVLWRYGSFDQIGAANFPPTNSFSVPRARTKLGGHVWDENQTFYVQLDWTSGSPLLDAWFRWAFWSNDDNSIGLRVGQQKPHHGREFQGSSAYLEHTDRSIVSRVFSGNRVIGAWVQGTHLADDKLHWNVGVGNGDVAAASVATEAGTGAANPDNELNFFADVRFDPWGDFGDEGYQQGDMREDGALAGTVGASVMIGNHRLGGATDVETTSLNVYAAAKASGFHVLTELFARRDDSDAPGGAESDAWGWTIGPSYTLPARAEGGSQWGFAARASVLEFDDAPVLLTGVQSAAAGDHPAIAGFGEGSLTELGATVSNYYHQHKLKTQLSYRHQFVDPTGPGNDFDADVAEILFQWLF